MKLSTQPYKGARDFYPEDKRLQKYIFSQWSTVCERYGYEEYDAPILEPLELYAAKSGDEIVNEQTYLFEDRGGRQVVIRPEMTPSVSRMVAARRQELPYPLRWYSMPVNWRYERPQKGRLREFWQLNVDLFGVANQSAEIEMIEIADAIMKQFGAPDGSYEILVNSRQLVDSFLQDELQLTVDTSNAIRRLIDKIDKISNTEFDSQLSQLVGDKPKVQIIDFLQATTLDELPAGIATRPAAQSLQVVLDGLIQTGIKSFRFAPKLMRGFDYYTGVVFEVFDTNPQNRRAMFGGGRYDGLVGIFGVDPVPTIGFGMGDVTLVDFLEANNLLPKLSSSVQVQMLPMGISVLEASKVAKALRKEGVNVAVDFSDNKTDKKIKSAVKRSIRYVVFVGPQELQAGALTVKDLDSGKERSLTMKALASLLQA
jgi:histidyl-tRNA synthetase